MGTDVGVATTGMVGMSDGGFSKGGVTGISESIGGNAYGVSYGCGVGWKSMSSDPGAYVSKGKKSSSGPGDGGYSMGESSMLGYGHGVL